MQLRSADIRDIIQDPDSKILIEKILKKNELETTSKIYISTPDGNRIGPFIQKTIKADSGLGKVYEILATEQVEDEKYLANIYYYNVCDGEITVIQEYVQGSTLEDFLSTNHTQKELLELMIALCESVYCLHESFSIPIIHRDIKPANIIVSDSFKVKLIDFGIARTFSESKNSIQNNKAKDNIDSDNNKERDTKIFGTVGYAPPEQFGFAQTTPRSDIYSLGKVLELLFSNSTKQNKTWLALNKSICPKCCELDPSRRFNNISEILGILKSANHVTQKYTNVIETNEKISEKYTLWTIIYDTLIIAAYILLTACSIDEFLMPDSSRMTEDGIVKSIIAFLVVDVFIITPIAFLCLKKAPLYKIFPKFPRITRKIGVIIICVCFVCVIFLMTIYMFVK